MSPEVIPMTRPPKQVSDFLDGLTEADLLAELDNPTQQVRDLVAPSPSATVAQVPTDGLEINSRLTIIKMFERAPEMGQHFTFFVRRFTGEAYVQAMRTTLAKARKLAREQNFDMGDPFKMIVLNIQTQSTMDAVTITRIPKGQKLHIKIAELAKLMGGSQVGSKFVDEDEEDD